MTWLTLFLLLFTSTPEDPVTIEHRFTVMHRGSEIGHIKAVETRIGNMVRLRVVSDVNYRTALYDYQRTTDVTAKFTDNLLFESLAVITESGDLESRSTTRKSGIAYQCFKLGESTFEVKETIPLSSICLYYREPVGHSKAWSETDLAFCALQPLPNNTYRLVLPDGKHNDYRYENGLLVEANITRTLFNITFLRQP
jgi:hypothetical protein